MSLDSCAQNLRILGCLNVCNTKDKRVGNITFCSKQGDTFESQNREADSNKNKKNNKLILFSLLAIVGLSCVVPAIKKRKVFNQECMSIYSQNVREALEYKNFSKIKYFKDLSFIQKFKSLNKLKRSNSADQFFATLNGNKPACFLGVKDGVSHLKNNKDFLADFDMICKNKDCFIFNKKKLKEIISNNKEIYSLRLGIDKNAGVEEIYNNLIKSNTFNRDPALQDLLGITLGFPKYSSMMFNLESMANLHYFDRKNPVKYKESLLEVLRGEKSPYKNLCETEFKNLEKHIEAYTGKNLSFAKNYYRFINLANETGEIARIESEINKFLKDFSSNKFVA